MFPEVLTITQNRAQNRQAIQILDEARDAVQTIHVGHSEIITGSVDGHVRTYDLRKGELRSDFMGRKSCSFHDRLKFLTIALF
jgi:mitogen-activated protein kinase organizer 1